MRLQFQKRSVLKLASRIIPRKRWQGGVSPAFAGQASGVYKNTLGKPMTQPTQAALKYELELDKKRP